MVRVHFEGALLCAKPEIPAAITEREKVIEPAGHKVRQFYSYGLLGAADRTAYQLSRR